jgi:hypothetical protein
MADPMRERMAQVIADTLGVSVQRASEAMHAAWEATKDEETGTPPSWQPDLSDPGQALARRVQEALEREFDGEELFPCVVVVQENRSRRIGLAATAISFGEVEQLIMLGRGAARRSLRQQGLES